MLKHSFVVQDMYGSNLGFVCERCYYLILLPKDIILGVFSENNGRLKHDYETCDDVDRQRARICPGVRRRRVSGREDRLALGNIG